MPKFAMPLSRSSLSTFLHNVGPLVPRGARWRGTMTRGDKGSKRGRKNKCVGTLEPSALLERSSKRGSHGGLSHTGEAHPTRQEWGET